MKSIRSNENSLLGRITASLVIVLVIAACGGGDGSIGTQLGDANNTVDAVNDVFPAIQSATGGSTAAVQLNDTVTINGTTGAAVLGSNASIAAVTRTSATPVAGAITLNTVTDVVTIAAGTSAGAYAFSYQLCLTAPHQTLCDIATVTGVVSVGQQPASDVVTLANVLACPASPQLISSSNWLTCLVGKRFVGTDPITAQVCELSVIAGGNVTYTHSGVVYQTSTSGQAARSGLYQYIKDQAPQTSLFQGILNWDLEGDTNRNRLTKINITIEINPDERDLIQIEYFDANSARRNLNCAFNL